MRGFGVHPKRSSACERIGSDDGARIILGAVYAIGIAGDGPDGGFALQRKTERKQIFGIAPATPPALHRCGGLTARDETAGLAITAMLKRQRRMGARVLARLAFDGI